LPAPTVIPSNTPTPVVTAVAGADGANVRRGPDLAYEKLGYLEPGDSVVVTGRYGGWFRIDYAGSEAWVYSGVVTVTNEEQVPEVEPPESAAAPVVHLAVVMRLQPLPAT
jgi:uncharacterized protein YraI